MHFIPESLVVDGRTLTGRVVRATQGRIDLDKLYGGFKQGDVAYVFANIRAKRKTRILMGAGADWWMQWWMNGRKICDTTKKGNAGWPLSASNNLFTATLQPGDNLICGRVISGSHSFAFVVGGTSAIPRRLIAMRRVELQYEHQVNTIDDRTMAKTMATILNRYRATVLSRGEDASLLKKATELASKLDAQGHWPDIDYADRSLAGWKPIAHLFRLTTISQAIAHSDHPSQSLLSAARRALVAWAQGGYTCENWYVNRIRTPMTMAPILTLLQPYLDNREMKAGLRVLAQVNAKDDWMTGQNTIWLAKLNILLGCLSHRSDLVREGLRHMAAVIHVSTGDSLQPDFSFHQHGPQLYAGSYGRIYANDVAYLIWLLRGTPAALPALKVHLMSRYLLEGQQWLVYGGMFSLLSQGRGMSRPHLRPDGWAEQLAQSARYLAAVDKTYASRLTSLAARVGGKKHAPPLTGNRYFWRSDFMVHRGVNYDVGLRMVSARTMATESLNSENLLGSHLSEGATLVRLHGVDYSPVLPVWNWRMVPGTTAVQGTRTPSVEDLAKLGTTQFVGGASDGTYGMTAYDFVDLHAQPTLSGHKASFFFDHVMICLGAGIQYSGVHRVVTTLDQRKLNGEAIIGGDAGAESFDDGLHLVKPGMWLWQDHLGYMSLDDQALHVRCAKQKGSWRRINQKYSFKPLEIPVFSVWIDHGKAPKAGGYAYLVAMNIDRGRMAELSSHVSVRVLSNTPALQAVAQPGKNILEAAFYQPGKLEFAGGHDIAVRQPCLVMWRQVKGRVRITVSDPTQKLRSVDLHVDGRPLRVELPGGNQAGKSVYYDLTSQGQWRVACACNELETLLNVRSSNH